MKILTKKQLTILFLLYRFRFLNRHQIQLLLHHKNHTRINYWLKYLTKNGYIGKHFLNMYGENNKPAFYWLLTPSKKFLEDNSHVSKRQLVKIYKENSRGRAFQNTSIAIADCYLYFLIFAKKIDNTVQFYTKSRLVTQNMDSYLPRTQSGVLLSLTGKSETKHYFLEYIDDLLTKYQQKRVVEQYFWYYENNIWQEHGTEPFPGVFLVCADTGIERSLRKFIKEKIETSNVNITFYTTIKKNITYDAKISNIWKKLI